MPGYKTHNTLNFLFFLPIYWAILLYGCSCNGKYLYTFSASFIYATFFLSPDLDLAHKVKLFSLRGLCTLPFRFYPRFFKHRGLSHDWFLGSLSRVLWLIAIVALLFGISFIQKTFASSSTRQILLYIFLGILAADLSHILLDHFPRRK